jgi:hypothetical protein
MVVTVRIRYMPHPDPHFPGDTATVQAVLLLYQDNLEKLSRIITTSGKEGVDQ